MRWTRQEWQGFLAHLESIPGGIEALRKIDEINGQAIDRRRKRRAELKAEYEQMAERREKHKAERRAELKARRASREGAAHV